MIYIYIKSCYDDAIAQGIKAASFFDGGKKDIADGPTTFFGGCAQINELNNLKQ
jgi:hypothetical protein